MLPSRGLPPRQLASLSSRQSSRLLSGTSRKFSSVPRKTTFSAPSCRTTPLRSSNWRAGAISTPNHVLSASTVRYGSWYAPWTWGRSGTPSNTTASPEPVAEPITPVAEPVVTTATPELQPAGIDQSAAATLSESSRLSDGKTVEELLGTEPTASVDSTFIDPTVPISYWGNLKDLGLDYGWGPSAFFESLLELVYINGEIGWAGTIVASALVLRTGLFFTFQRWGSDAMVKTASMRPLLQPLQDQMEEAKRQGDDERVQMLKMKQQGIMKDVGVDIWKSMGTAVAQGVFGYGAWRSLRGIASLPAPGMTTDGLWWFSDLTVADPYYILPVVTGGLMYQVIKRGGETGMQNETAQTSMQKQIQLILPVVMTAVTAFQPAAIQLYFFCTSITGAITGYSLRQPAVRRFLGIRPLPTRESQDLYSKVIKGEIEYSSIKGADGKVRYQAPRSAASAPGKTTLASGINLKRGTALPAHMARAADKEVSDEQPKSKWEQLKATPTTVKNKIAKFQDPRDPEVKKRQDAKDKQKRALFKYEEERQKRMREQ